MPSHLSTEYMISLVTSFTDFQYKLMRTILVGHKIKKFFGDVPVGFMHTV